MKDKNELLKPTKPRGAAIEWTDEELEDYCSAENMERLAQEAAADWRQNAPQKFKELLDAQSE